MYAGIDNAPISRFSCMQRLYAAFSSQLITLEYHYVHVAYVCYVIFNK